MHLSEGVLHTPILLAGAVLAVAGIAVGLRRLESERLPLTALLPLHFFVAGTIHVPVGIGSVHLILNGMAGLFLGWAVFQHSSSHFYCKSFSFLLVDLPC